MKPPTPPTLPPPPAPQAVPSATDDTTDTIADRQRKLAAMKFGFASTMTAKSNAAPALAAPAAVGGKTKTGQ